MPHRRPRRLIAPLRHASVWVIAPLAVATVVYVGLWQRYEHAQAEADRLPTAVAAELARLPPRISTLVAIAFTASASDRPRSRDTLAWHLRSALTLADARGRVHARATGPRTATISFATAPGGAGCAAIRVGPRAALRVAYARTRGGACTLAARRLRSQGAGP
jgi:hypothetical protein